VAVAAGCADDDSRATPAADAYVDISLCEPDRIGLGSSGEQRRGRQHGSRRRDCKQCVFHCRSSLGFRSHPNDGSTKSFRPARAKPLAMGKSV
jgi:hypothetical protein